MDFFKLTSEMALNRISRIVLVGSLSLLGSAIATSIPANAAPPPITTSSAITIRQRLLKILTGSMTRFSGSHCLETLMIFHPSMFLQWSAMLDLLGLSFPKPQIKLLSCLTKRRKCS